MVRQFRKSYRNESWINFSEKIKKRDNYKCLKCGRSSSETILQVHHRLYKQNFKPWEYALSDCLTLCKGCHSRTHGLVEPNFGWTLISIDDLGDLSGICERRGCDTDIRYVHEVYHPNWGYLSVGSSCVEILTREDQQLSKKIISKFKLISDFVNSSSWNRGVTKKGKKYIFTTHSFHQIRIYGEETYDTYQLVIKRVGEKWFDYGKFFHIAGKTLPQIKELAFIALKGTISKSEKEKAILRNIYKRTIT